MSDNVTDFGWNSAEGLHSADYINPTILKIVEAEGVKKILDLGSGNGFLCSRFNAKNLEAVGLEYDLNGVNIAKETYPSIPFYQFNINDNPGELLDREGLFDAVVSTEVIEHLYSPHRLPAFAHEMLCDDGVLIISTPYHGYLKNLLLALFNKMDQHMDPLWHGGHIKLWSKNTLSTLLEQNGFVVEGFYGVGRLPFLWKSMVMVARKSNVSNVE